MRNDERKPLQPLSRGHLLPTEGKPPDIPCNGDELLSCTGQERGSHRYETKKMSALEKFKDVTFSKRSIFVVVLCSLGSFCDGCLFSIMAPFFPQKAEQKGGSSTFTGVIFAIFQFTVIVTSPVFGNYITQIGLKFLYVSGMFVSGCSTLLFGIVDKSSSGVAFMALSFSCRLFQSLGMSAMMTASFTMLSSEFPNNVATMFGLLLTVEAMGLMIGPTLGGALYEVGGFGLPFFVLGALLLLNGIFIYVCLPPPKDVRPETKQSILTLMRSPLVFVCFVCNSSVALGLAFLDPTLADHLETFNLRPLFVGLMFVIAPGIHALLAPLWGHLADHKNIQSPQIVLGNLILCIGILCIGPCPWLPFIPLKLWIIITGLLLYGIGAGSIIITVMKAILIGAFELGFEDNLQTYGIVSGLYNASFCLGATIGPILGGVLVQNIGFRFGTSILAILHLFMMTISVSFFLLRKARKRRADKSDIFVKFQPHIKESTTT